METFLISGLLAVLSLTPSVTGVTLENLDLLVDPTVIVPTRCGHHMTTDNGNFASPNYPNVEAALTECSWTISAPVRKLIALTIVDIGLNTEPDEFYDNCPDDWSQVAIYDGDDELIDRLCSFKTPVTPFTIVSRSNVMKVDLAIDDYNTPAKGISAEYRFIDACGGILNGESGHFGSPQPYIIWQLCKWTIPAVPGKRIKLNIDSFTFDPDCADTLEIHEAGSGTSATLCGDGSGPKEFDSRSDITVTFTTRPKSESVGFFTGSSSFQASYSFINDTETLTDAQGTINHASKNDPTRYIIKAPQGKKISLTLQASCSEGSSIQLKEGGVVMFDNICNRGSPENVYASHGNELAIFFNSDNNEDSFSASYNTFACGGDLPLTTTGVITSPFYPGLYPNGVHCLWNITAPDGKFLYIEFDKLNFPAGSCGDQAFIYKDKVATESEKRIGTCYLTEGRTFWSLGQTLLVAFRSDGETRDTGFSANLWVLGDKHRDTLIANDITLGK